MRVLIADHHPIVRTGLKEILSAALPDTSFGEAETDAEMLECVGNEPWNLVILEADLPDQNGLEVLQEIKDLQADTPVLIFTIRSKDEFEAACVTAGAQGYLVKSALPGEVVSAVNKVVSGERYSAAQMEEKLGAQVSVSSKILCIAEYRAENMKGR
jgi:two-component system, NarL family, invasion response regulator UvrY